MFEKPFKSSLKDKRWLTELFNGLTKFSKLQEGFKEIANFVKQNRNELNERKESFYDEIEILRIKYEHGQNAAWKYQDQCEKLDSDFIRTFIDKDITLRNDLDDS